MIWNGCHSSSFFFFFRPAGKKEKKSKSNQIESLKNIKLNSFQLIFRFNFFFFRVQKIYCKSIRIKKKKEKRKVKKPLRNPNFLELSFVDPPIKWFHLYNMHSFDFKLDDFKNFSFFEHLLSPEKKKKKTEKKCNRFKWMFKIQMLSIHVSIRIHFFHVLKNLRAKQHFQILHFDQKKKKKNFFNSI